MINAVNWFEIPVVDIQRAVAFYNLIFDIVMQPFEMTPGFPMAQFPTQPGTVGGCIIQGEGYTPRAEGVVIYLNGGTDLNDVLNKVETAGGQALSEKIDIGESGFCAYFLDTEGNKIGLHSMG